MNHRTGHQQDGYRNAKKQQQRQQAACERYLMLRDLVLTHEEAQDPDHQYIKELRHRRDMLKKQLINAGVLD